MNQAPARDRRERIEAQWGVFERRDDGKYTRERAIALYGTMGAAERHAKRLNLTNAVHIVRGIV